MTLWRWGAALLAAVSLVMGVVLVAWGVNLCLDAYESVRVLPDGRTVAHAICLRRAVDWAMMGLGGAVLAGGLLAGGAAALVQRRTLLAALLALAAAPLTLPLAALAQGQVFLAVPIALVILGAAGLAYRPFPPPSVGATQPPGPPSQAGGGPSPGQGPAPGDPPPASGPPPGEA